MRGLAASLALLLTTNPAGGQEWIDVTGVLVTNPHFDGNSTTGWQWESNAGSQTARAGCMEFWQGTFDFWQTVTNAPEGRYRLRAQGYYRTGDNEGAYQGHLNGNEVLTARLYGGDEEEPLVSVYSEELGQWTDGCWTYREGGNWWGGTEHYFPNTMESAAVAFANGSYENSVEFVLEGGDSFRIGVRNDSWTQSNWAIFTNFRLEYQGEAVKVASLSLAEGSRQMVVGETLQAEATVLPANALVKTLRWTSTNERVATVSAKGLIEALAPGTATIAAHTTDGSNLSATMTVTVEQGLPTAGSLVVNEVMASNVDEWLSPANNFDGWIELYNPTDKAVSLAGCYLSNDATQPRLWQMPKQAGAVAAKGYKVVWADSHELKAEQAPFKLDVAGGTLLLSAPDGTLLATQSYPASQERTSWARKADGSWGTTATPTPGTGNEGSTWAQQQTAAPVADQPSQLFTTPLSVNVTIPAGQTLRYTTDGTLPTLENGETSRTGQFHVTETTCLRLRLYAEGQLPSRVTTRSYIYKDRAYTLPVVSVVSDPRFLYDPETGVLVRGTNGRPGNGQQTACNWNMDWERPVNFSYLDAGGEMVLNQDVDLEMCGGWSRAWEPHSFKLKGSKELGGEKNLLYPFFEQKPYIRNRTLQIRNGGNDNNGRMKDPALQYIVETSGVDIDCQSYQPVHEFINGEYIGMLNVREPNNKHYVEANYGWGDDEIDQFEMSPDSGYVQKCGTAEAYELLCDVLSPDAANSETYAEICRLLDIDNYANYMAAEFYLGGTDWPQNNVKGFRHRDGGRFRFVLFDLDGTFATNDPFNTFMWKETYTFDQLYPVELGRKTDHIRFVTLFKNLLQNADFRRKFIDAYSMMGGSVLEASRAAAIVDELTARAEPAMALEGRSGNMRSSANGVKNQLAGRLNTANSALKNFATFGLGQTTAQRVELKSNIAAGRIAVNGMDVPTGRFDGYLYAPARLTASAPAGYEFLGWETSAGTATTLLGEGSTWRYYDQGSLDNQNWTAPTYGEAGWKSGRAPLGYGKSEIATTLDYGNDGNQKRPTVYLRTTVELQEAPSADDAVSLTFTVDDGAVVYVNGTEAGRYNMPAGSVGYDSYASSYAPNNPDRGTMALRPTLLHKGTNVIAVELHNNSGSSTDLMWDAALTTTGGSTSPQYYSTERETTLPKGTTVTLTARWRAQDEQTRRSEGVSPVRINEVSGQNDSFVDEYGKKGDWVELYNTTDEETDVEGWLLTDNLEKPTKYVITKGNTNAQTKIAPHGYLLVWCDNKRATTSQGLHANFKIDGDGGVLQLTSADRQWQDTFYYGSHDARTTIGRYPDGSNDIYAMNVATIGRTNRMSSYAEKTDQEALKEQMEQTGLQPTLASHANGYRLRYGNGRLLVMGEDDGPVTIELFGTDGRQIERLTATVTGGKALVDVSHLGQGFYVARATIDRETRVGCKFVR